jgi:fructokinase
VGAGDAFTAALIMGILNQRPLSQIHGQASRIAAYVCTQRGAVVPLPESLTSM